MGNSDSGKYKMAALLLCLGIVLAWPAVSPAAIVVNDHFNNSSLDPLWSVSYENATGWSYAEAGTNLTATDISEIGNSSWARVHLSRSFVSISDFHIDFDFGWDSASSNAAMQYLYLTLLDSSNNIIATAGYGDSWVTSPGTSRVWIGSEGYSDTATLPLSGTALMDLHRTGDDLDVYWNGSSLLSGESSALLTGVRISFGYYPYIGGDGTSFFGTESVDLVKVEGTPVPIPAGAWLLGSGLIGLVAIRRRMKQ